MKRIIALSLFSVFLSFALNADTSIPPSQLETWKNAGGDIQRNLGSLSFQIPTAARMAVGAAASWYGFHLLNIPLEDYWAALTLSTIQVGVFNHLNPVLKRWYYSFNPVKLSEQRPGTLGAFGIFIVKGTAVILGYNFVTDSINHLAVDHDFPTLYNATKAASLYIFAQSFWAQALLKETDAAKTPEEKKEAWARFNRRIVTLASATVGLNKLSLLGVDWASPTLAAISAAGAAYYFFAPAVRRQLGEKSIITYLQKKVVSGFSKCASYLTALQTPQLFRTKE